MKHILKPTLNIHPEAYHNMLNHVNSVFNEEVCGLAVGRNQTIFQGIPIESMLHSPNAYQMNPQEQINAFINIERHNLKLLAIYHSHPAGPDHPSQQDIREFAYPDIATIIWSPLLNGNKWKMKVFHIQGKDYSQVEYFWIK